MKNLVNKSLISALSFLFVMAFSPITNATENPFGMSDASSGTNLQVAGKCGSSHMEESDGKCGGAKKVEEKKSKCGEGKCGGKMKAESKKGKCGDSMKADSKKGKCGDSMKNDNKKSKCGGK